MDWIKTIDCLPEKDVRVLAVSKGGNVIIAILYYASEMGHFWMDEDCNGFTQGTLTHWQLLPAPPK